jgi:hypothetical protein
VRLNERKIVKTISLKKVSAVAVASLGFGLLSVVPAQAAVTTARTVLVDAVLGNGGSTFDSATGKVNGNIGIAAVKDVALTTVTGADAAEVISITPVLTSSPSGSTVTVGTAGTAKVGMTSAVDAGNVVAADASAKWTNAIATGVNTLTRSSGTAAALTAVKTAVLSLTADIAGTYVVTLNPTSTTGTGTNTPAVVTFVIQDLYGSTADGLTSGTQANTAINGVAGAFNNVTLSVQTVVGQRLIAVTGGTISAFTTGANSTGTIATDKTTMVVADASNVEVATFTVATPTVGEITVKLYDTAQGGIFKTTAAGSVTITVAAAAQAGAVDTALTTAVLSNTGAGDTSKATVNSAATTLTAPSTSAVKQGQLAISITTVAGSLSSSTVQTATITGPGYLVTTGNNTNSTGRSLVSVGSDNSNVVEIYGDGSTGTSTVTVTAGAFTKTITVVFYGSAKTLTATQVLTHASTAGAKLGDEASATTNAATVKVVDATGNPVVGVTPTVVSATTSVIASGTCSASSSTGLSFCSVTSAANTAGKTASVTFKTVVSGVDVVSNALTFTLGGALSKFTWAFGAASYAAGSKMTITITGVDSTGAPTFDGAKDIFVTAITPSAASSYSSTADLAGVDFVGGKGTITMFAPLTAGPFSVTAGIESGFQTAMGATSSTVSTTVTDGNAALLTQIDALNAKIVALNALIAKIMKKLGVK